MPGMSNVLHARHAGLHLALRTYGHGPVHVLAFHGFGRTGTDFHFLEPAFAERCTVHAFDLPFHGIAARNPERTRQPYGKAEFAAFFRNTWTRRASTRPCSGLQPGRSHRLMPAGKPAGTRAEGVLLAPGRLVCHPGTARWQASVLDAGCTGASCALPTWRPG